MRHVEKRRKAKAEEIKVTMFDSKRKEGRPCESI